MSMEEKFSSKSYGSIKVNAEAKRSACDKLHNYFSSKNIWKTNVDKLLNDLLKDLLDDGIYSKEDFIEFISHSKYFSVQFDDVYILKSKNSEEQDKTTNLGYTEKFDQLYPYHQRNLEILKNLIDFGTKKSKDPIDSGFDLFDDIFEEKMKNLKFDEDMEPVDLDDRIQKVDQSANNLDDTNKALVQILSMNDEGLGIEIKFHFANQLPTVMEIMTEMVSTYHNLRDYNMKRKHLAPGLLCAVFDSCMWFRARIMLVHPSMVEVLLIDFGNKLDVPFNKIKHLTKRFLKYPAQSNSGILLNFPQNIFWKRLENLFEVELTDVEYYTCLFKNIAVTNIPVKKINIVDILANLKDDEISW